MIATWKSDLNRVLYVLGVRSVTPLRISLTVRSQTELEINASVHFSDPQWSVVNFHTIVSELHHNVTNTHTTISDAHRSVSTVHTTFSDFHHTTVSDLRYNIVNSHATVSDTHHTMVKSLSLPDSRNRLVSVTCTLLFTE